MKISCNILKKHIKDSQKIDFLRIWDTFTIRTAEVEGIEIKGNDFDNVVTAKIIECEKHPKSDKLSILKVDDGTNHHQIVCGAPNVRVGFIGALIRVGGHLGDIEIGKRPLAGVDSYGMMCSGLELGISEDHDGIIELPEDTPLGIDIKEVLPVEDIIVEIDNKSLTNRPDLWGHYGIAREISAITGHELLPLDLEEPISTGNRLNINILEEDLCYRYTSIKLDNITNHKTPLWMQIFLHYTEMKSISLIIDLTNYIMLELGQPMHAFDSRVVKDIEVGLANDKDKFKTLDNIERTLTSKDLMIKNGGDYFGIAGVMGGLDSEIVNDTTSIVLESASFEASNIRKTSIIHGLRTEASTRYEKSLDPNVTIIAAKRFYKLLKEVNPNLVQSSDLIDIYPTKLESKEITLSKELLYKYLDFKMQDEVVESILASLEFKVSVKEDCFNVTIPTFRVSKDVTIPADLIEEIARIYGYENFEPKALKMDLSFISEEPDYKDAYDLKNYLSIKYNLNEVHTYLWNKTSFLKDLNINLDNVKLEGKKEDNILRNDLNLSLLEVAKTNVNNYGSFGIYEIGNIIKNNENHRMLSILLSDYELKLIYNKAKNIVSHIFKDLKNLDTVFEFADSDSYYNKDLVQNIIVNNKVIGQIKVFNKTTSNKISKRHSFVVIEIDWEMYLDLVLYKPVYVELSKYPSTELDYTIITNRGEYYEKLENILNEFTSPIILKRDLLEIYLEEESKNVTIRFTIGTYDKTLTNKDLLSFKESFINFLAENDLKIME